NPARRRRHPAPWAAQPERWERPHWKPPETAWPARAPWRQPRAPRATSAPRWDRSLAKPAGTPRGRSFVALGRPAAARQNRRPWGQRLKAVAAAAIPVGHRLRPGRSELGRALLAAEPRMGASAAPNAAALAPTGCR